MTADEAELDEERQPRARSCRELTSASRPQDAVERAPVHREPVIEDEAGSEDGERPRKDDDRHDDGHDHTVVPRHRSRCRTSRAPNQRPVITRPWGKLYGK